MVPSVHAFAGRDDIHPTVMSRAHPVLIEYQDKPAVEPVV